MKKYYEAKLRCVTCAGVDFEFNKDQSYIKCNTCGREYLGGYNELLEYNQDVQEDIFHQVQEDAEKIVKTELKKVFKEINKEIKIK